MPDVGSPVGKIKETRIFHMPGLIWDVKAWFAVERVGINIKFGIGEPQLPHWGWNNK